MRRAANRLPVISSGCSAGSQQRRKRIGCAELFGYGYPRAVRWRRFFLRSSCPCFCILQNRRESLRSGRAKLRIYRRLRVHTSQPSRTKAHALTVSRPRLRHQKARRVTTRDAANLFNYPLTHQEKLLVEFARTATPDELKELNPEYQAKMEAKQEAEFAAYLKSGEDSGNSSMSSTGAEANSEIKTAQE